ncbi:uncharacterized protein BKCO1_17000101 [Diplodia corticola]|uniref:Uncharacterized protein n=1 Tax=Diplodia corticola TaxID=236234 RepID=A0A1J9RS43_9PEZI|nr:uncharacterized protein BKCO1_17000101 [Diplodia corticola]OJD35371.1 hypothetical protein BKCO1_17000101 [Diplodia corticola]
MAGGRRRSTRIAAKPAPVPKPEQDSNSDSSDNSSSDMVPSLPSYPESDSDDAYTGGSDASAAADDDAIDAASDLASDTLDLGEPTKRSHTKSTKSKKGAAAAAGTSTSIAATAAIDTRSQELMEKRRRAEEKARLLPSYRGAAWLLAHPPRKAIRQARDSATMTMERSWMNRRMPFAFKNNNTRMRTSCGIELFSKRPIRDGPVAGGAAGKDKKGEGKKKGGADGGKKKFGDWSRPEHGVNELNLQPDFVKFLWDDGMPGESVKEPVDITDRQVVRCDENFGLHRHANDGEHPDGFTCCESRKSHLDLYMKLRRRELESDQQQGQEAGEDESDDESEDESGKKKGKSKATKKTRNRRNSARWTARKAKITDKLVLEEVHTWEDHDFAICVACDDEQLYHLTPKAGDGHFHGALVPLCQDCSLLAVDQYGFGFNGCACDQERRCLNHRIEHLEELADVRDAYVKKNQPKGDHPALRIYNKLHRKADKKEAAGDEDFIYPEVTPVCPNCRTNFPPPVPTHFAYSCIQCEQEVVIPAPDETMDLEEGSRWQSVCEEPQSFVENLGQPVARSLPMLEQKGDWNPRWVDIFKQFAANQRPEDVESDFGSGGSDAAAADDELAASNDADVEQHDDTPVTTTIDDVADNGLTPEEEYHLNLAGAMDPSTAPTTTTTFPTPTDTTTEQQQQEPGEKKSTKRKRASGSSSPGAIDAPMSSSSSSSSSPTTAAAPDDRTSERPIKRMRSAYFDRHLPAESAGIFSGGGDDGVVRGESEEEDKEDEEV